MSRKDLTWLIAVLAAAFALGTWLRWSALPGRDARGNETVAEVLADRLAPADTPAGATATMVVFTDYQCPACRLSDRPMRAALRADGKVRIIYRDLPVFGPASESAARLALAARYQGLYSKVHEQLMHGSIRIDEAAQRRAVALAGGDWARLQADLARHRPAIEAELLRTRMDAVSLGIRGTPTYVIGYRLIEGALSERQFTKAFAAAREK